ncbi:pyridoxal phosphate-dependent transferase [Amylostereum chailletii]|nr:pyridoxal phosphate-dependent transferase [Amylostereum chailletii]
MRSASTLASATVTLNEKHDLPPLPPAHYHSRYLPPPPPPPLPDPRAYAPLPPPRPAPTRHILPPPSTVYASPSYPLEHVCQPQQDDPAVKAAAKAAFDLAYPEYAPTFPLDALRAAEYSRLLPGDVYMDAMGGALYPAMLVRAHMAFLEGAVLGSTHSESRSSLLSTAHAAAARAAVLEHFNAPPGSKVVFTANASAALKLVGETFPFGPGSTYLLPEDAHNSVHGIRQFAASAGAEVVYIPGRKGRGGVDVAKARDAIVRHAPRAGRPALFALTGLSNLTNTPRTLRLPRRRPPAHTDTLLALAHAHGYLTLLDAAALAPTSALDMRAARVDALAVSFYKMFGFPTGVGALVLGPGVGEWLVGPWFAGGTVDVVQVPGTLVTRARSVEEAFEDGTLNYLLLPAIPTGLTLLRAYLPFLPTRLAALTHYLCAALAGLRHARTGARAVRVLSRVPGAISRADDGEEAGGTGGVVSCVFVEDGCTLVPLSVVAESAAANGVMLRTGCMCNPGGAAALLDLAPFMAALRAGTTLGELERAAGRELGVVRMSFGLASDWEDAWAVAAWARRGVESGWAGFRG